jgi:glutathione S-transferase
MLRVFGRANSFNVRKVLWTCDEIGIPFEREDWGRGYQPTSDPRFLEVNPIGLVPAVIDGDVVLRESNTIVRYLATKHGRSDLYPADAAARANVEQWMDWANYETSISLRGAFLGGMLNEPPWNNPWFIELGRRQITKEVGQLDKHLTESNAPYVTGDAFTVADIPIGLVVNRWFCLNFDRPDYKAVAAYYDRLTERPAYRRHVRNGLP